MFVVGFRLFVLCNFDDFFIVFGVCEWYYVICICFCFMWLFFGVVLSCVIVIGWLWFWNDVKCLCDLGFEGLNGMISVDFY